VYASVPLSIYSDQFWSLLGASCTLTREMCCVSCVNLTVDTEIMSAPPQRGRAHALLSPVKDIKKKLD